MNKFKIGDVVKVLSCVNTYGGFLTVGCVREVVSMDEHNGWCSLEGDEGVLCKYLKPENLELVNEGLVPHIHQKEIIAWVYGAEIEYEFYKDYWVPCPSDPKWLRHVKYRVKPTKTPTQIAIGEKEIELVKLKQQDLVERGIAEVLK